MNNGVIASGFAGGHAGHMLSDNIRKEGITTNFIFTEGDTRTNTSILDLENETLTEINDFGQEIEPEDLEFFLENYSRLLHRSKMVVLAGSLPQGLSKDTYVRMIQMANKQNKKIVFHAAPKYCDPIMGYSPFLINPDMRSSHQLLGKPLDGVEQFMLVGKDILLQNRDTEIVLFTHRIENVVAVTRSESYILYPQDLNITNMLGYADAYLAGFIHKYIENGAIPEALKFASAVGLSNVESLYKIAYDAQTVNENLERILIEKI
jgi:fructose-1-phosphate kinase PfkB-like protein